MTLEKDTKLGAYQILSPLGAGGMGEVYRAKDTRLGRDVAIKVLPEEFFEDEGRRARFEREARTLATLNHPGIAAIYSFEEAPGSSPSSSRHLLVMELVEGEGLDGKISRGPLSLEESLSVARQIAEALEAAHEKGIVHRDLKPSNVKVTEDGKVKLLDFGLAKAFEGEGNVLRPGSGNDQTQSPTLTARATAAGVILGTAAYMSPEQARGKAVDRRTDVWAFGCLLYEMLTGKRAFEGETVSDTLAAILKEDPEWTALPAGTPEKVREVLRKCLRRNAKQRLHDIADARLDLEEAAEAPFDSSAGATSADSSLPFEEEQAAPGSTVGRSAPAIRERGSRRSLYLSSAAAAALAAAAGAFGVLAHRARAPEPQVVRSAVLLPPGLRFAGQDGAVALSRDGRRLAFAATARDGKRCLWVRSLDSLGAQAIEGTESANTPFWSPDGRSIAFFADRKLKRVPASGGTVQTVCDAAEPRGGTWGDGDVIVFAPAPFGGLLRVSAAGGAPVGLTSPNEKGATDRLPAFLPGGTRVLYFHGTGLKAKENGIYCVALSGGQVTRVSPENSGPLLAPGFLVFVRGGNLMAQRFDASSLRLDGDAAVLAQHVWFNGFRWTANASVSDTGLLVAEPGGEATKSQLTWMDLEGRADGTVGAPAQFQDLAMSPDGRRALAIIPDEDGVNHFWMYDLERSVASRFAPEATAGAAAWSPDGKQVAYSDMDGNVFVKATGGLSEARQLIKVVSVNQRPTSWTADGGTLVIDRQDPESWNLMTVSLAGNPAPRPLLATPAQETFGRVSADGKWLAFVSDETGRNEVYVMPFPNGEKEQVSSSGGDIPLWLGRSGDLAWSNEGRLMAARVGPGGPGPPRPLLGGVVVANRSAVASSPDGKRLLVAMPVEGSGSGTLTLVANWPVEVSKR